MRKAARLFTAIIIACGISAYGNDLYPTDRALAAVPSAPAASTASTASTPSTSSTPPARSAQAPYPMNTYTYKTVGDLKIQADVYRPNDSQPRPALVWLHGGALMMGSKKWVQPDLLELSRAQGYCLVSANYRLAPQVKLPEIIGDLRDFMKWINEKGPELFHADASRIVVAGSSAGGYLTMMTGIIEPRPKALVAYYGYGDVDGPWYTTPSEFYRKQPLVSKDEAYKGMTSEVVTEPVQGPFNRGRLYLYFRQNGLWTKEVTGFDPSTERTKIAPFCPARNITPQYPPIIMLHGTEDTDVPCQESLDMAEQLKKNNVRYELFTIPGGNHGLNRGDKQMIARAMTRAREFIKERLGSQPPLK
ncbi:MAG: alpha/beta hydrolase [Candidatus Sumerlaeota bacterium]|nr:alpha/beta hydrolase [Candidatus Sumerlaeota bacterium]